MSKSPSKNQTPIFKSLNLDEKRCEAFSLYFRQELFRICVNNKGKFHIDTVDLMDMAINFAESKEEAVFFFYMLIVKFEGIK
jgi:hypothetical protein